jgi:serine protease Do
MSVRSLNWLKFGGLVGFAFILGLVFASLLDLPKTTLAQNRDRKADSARVLPASSPEQTVTTARSGASPLVMLSDAFAAVAEQVRPSVVYIRSRRTERAGERRPNELRLPGFEDFFGNPPQGRGRNNQPQVEQGAGSGFVVSDQGYILTNNHVVDGADEVTVRLLDRHEFKAKVVGTDPLTDVAVIKIEPRNGINLKAASLGSSTAARVGEWVLAVGNPLSENLNFTVTSGIISAKGRGRLPLPGAGQYAIQDFLQTDAAINRGNSGGPLLNVRGEVIGINSAIFSPTGVSAGYAFAIPIDLARQVMDQLISKGKVERAALGVSVQEATAVDAEAVGLTEIYGVRVDAFTDDAKSPAKAAGIQPGDIIISIDGQRVEYVAQLQQLVGFRRPGETVKVEVAREGGVRKVYNVRLANQMAPARLAAREGDEAEPDAGENSTDLKDRLGVTVEPLDAQAAQELELPSTTRGVIVQTVDPYGPTDGLLNPPSQQSVDLITGIDGKPIRNEAELRAALRAVRPGEIVSLAVTIALGGGEYQNRLVRVKIK